ncbi:MAG TPA: Uma2 family endonuclease [Thermosynechococcaceae cyanobacterium]
MPLTVKDLEKVQEQLPNHRMELVEGEIILTSPSSYESDEVSTRISTFVGAWVIPRSLGRVTGSSAGFILPNSDTRAPDVSFVLADRLPRSPRSFAELAPDLMVEVKSPTDRSEKLRTKIQDFLAQGTQVGLLVNPEDRTVEIHRLDQKTEILRDGDLLTVPELLPGWEVPVVELWAPEFG